MSDTINLGIDLGTTNSVIAIAQHGSVEIIKNRNSEITPSMVAYDKRGSEKIGLHARQQYGDPKRGPDVQAEFKRLMGQDVPLKFKNCGLEKSPEELSSAVLADLRRAAEERFEAIPEAAVITVPAMFELPQNEATAKAAQLAGFTHSQLLQEPVAAAIAYGMEPSSEKALWLMYDYGGGTFDASLISIRDGALTVVKHAGNNYLGGADLDWKIVDELLLPTIANQFDIGALRRHDDKHRPSVGRLRRLKGFAEEIKIDLSSKEQSECYREPGVVFDDDHGNPVEIDLSVTREHFESMIEEDVEKTIRITSNLIHESGYSPSDIEQIVLVGGSTFMPLVRRRVRSLGIPITLKLDPMTVVARGAAVYASTQPLPKSSVVATETRKAGTATVSLEYERITKQANPLVGGRVTIARGSCPTECRLTITRDDDGFTSGSLALDATGMFYTNVQIGQSGQFVFRLELLGPDGKRIIIHPAEFVITNGLSVGKAKLPSGCGIALADGSAEILAKAGISLPTDGHNDYRTTRDLKAGSSDCLVVPFLSGNETRADHNLVSTQIKIFGNQIKRDLPSGSPVEINIHIDESGVPHPRVYIERLDEEFEPIDKDGRTTLLEHEPPDVMRERLIAAQRKLATVSEKAEKTAIGSVTIEVEQLEASDRAVKISGLITAWEAGDHVAAGRARNDIVEFTKEVDRIDTLVDWPAKVAEFDTEVSEVKELLNELGQNDLTDSLNTIIAEGKRSIDEHDPKMLDDSITNLDRIRMTALQRDPRFWAGMLQFCADKISDFPDQVRARELLAEGAGAMQRGDSDSLESVCRQLFNDLPSDVANEAQGAAIRSDIMR